MMELRNYVQASCDGLVIIHEREWYLTELSCVWWCCYGCSGEQHSVIVKSKGENVQLLEGFEKVEFNRQDANTSTV